MNIGGFQKTSLIDYPDLISAIIWAVKCNFYCPFCYNKNLVEGNVEMISEDEVFNFLKKRKNVLEGLVISGGEPFLQKDITDFTKKVKKLGYKVKIDTNGTYPEKLKELIDKKQVDYVAMDIKAPIKKYNKLTGVKTNISKIKKSVDIIQKSNLDYEFRTTIIPDLLKKEDIVEIAKWLDGSKNYYIQQFKNNTPLISYKMKTSVPYDREYIFEILDDIKPYFENCDVRGI